jgi:hypothetical protein
MFLSFFFPFLEPQPWMHPFVLFKHGYCMSICVVYTRKSCTCLMCLNNVWHSCLDNMNLWNNKFLMNLEQTHTCCKFVMYQLVFIIFILLKAMALQKGKIGHYVKLQGVFYIKVICIKCYGQKSSEQHVIYSTEARSNHSRAKLLNKLSP